jgi:hypothetical protein
MGTDAPDGFDEDDESFIDFSGMGALPWWMQCPRCGGPVRKGCCAACGVEGFAPLPRWETAVMAIAALLVVAGLCVAAPFYLTFALIRGVGKLWSAQRRGGPS